MIHFNILGSSEKCFDPLFEHLKNWFWSIFQDEFSKNFKLDQNELFECSEGGSKCFLMSSWWDKKFWSGSKWLSQTVTLMVGIILASSSYQSGSNISPFLVEFICKDFELVVLTRVNNFFLEISYKNISYNLPLY